MNPRAARLPVVTSAGLIVVIGMMVCNAHAVLFSKTTGEQRRDDGSVWQVSVTETERLPRLSVIKIGSQGRLPSVGSSMFIACTVRDLARLRGFRYVAQLEQGDGLRLGFLDRLEDDPAAVHGPAFAGLPPQRKYDVEFVSPICDLMDKKAQYGEK